MTTDAPDSPPAHTTDAAGLQRMLESRIFSAWVAELGLRVREVREPGGQVEIELALPIAARHVHGGGVLCGQTMMAAADTAMVLAITRQQGGFRPMTTVQLQTSFLRPVPAPKEGETGEATVVARVLRPGRSLVFGEIELLDPAGRLAAHATTTYALL